MEREDSGKTAEQCALEFCRIFNEHAEAELRAIEELRKSTKAYFDEFDKELERISNNLRSGDYGH